MCYDGLLGRSLLSFPNTHPPPLSWQWQAIFKNSKLWESVLSLSPKQVAEELTRLVRECWLQSA